MENLTSILNLVSGLTPRDQQEWLNLIMEAVSADDPGHLKDHLSAAKPNIKEYMKEIRSPIDGTPLYFTKENVSRAFGDVETRRIDTYEALSCTYSPDQLRELNRTGYALMRRDQLELIYGPQSPYNNSRVLQRLAGMNESALRAHLEQDIHLMGEMRSFQLRQRDVVLSPVSFTAEINGPLVPGFTVLSPLLFAPAVLSELYTSN